MISLIGTKKQIRPPAFTLIELVIVAAILLVLIAISTPLFKGTHQELEFKDAAYNLSKMIQYAQQKAIMEEKKYRLSFDFDRRAYRLLVRDETKIEIEPSGREEAETEKKASGWKGAGDRFSGYYYLPEGVKFKGDGDKITFLPNGRCDKVSIYIINRENRIFEIKTNGRAGYVAVSEVEK